MSLSELPQSLNTTRQSVNNDVFMAVIGFNFTKILVERKTPLKGKVDISNNVSVKNVEYTDLLLGDSLERYYSTESFST